MSDELDRRLRSWGEQQRAAQSAPTVPLERMTQRSGRRAWAATGGVAVVAAVVVVGVSIHQTPSEPSAGHGPSSSPRSPTSTATGAQDPYALVLHDGDTVTASGTVVAIPGKPVRFCAPNVPVATNGSASGNQAAPTYCDFGINVVGADLATLYGRREKGGAIEGSAQLTGVYHGVTLTVSEQGAASEYQRPQLNRDTPPCPAPAGGWPTTGADESTNLDDQPASTYMQAHPGMIVMIALLRPSADQVLMYLLTTGDPAPVEAAMRPAYGARLCVVKSKYTKAEVDTAHSAVTDAMTSADSKDAGIYDAGGTGLGAGEQIQVSADMVMVTPALARLAAAQPAGLVVLNPWLRPS